MASFDVSIPDRLTDDDGREIPQARWLPTVAEFVNRMNAPGVDVTRRLPAEAATLVRAVVDQRVKMARLVDELAAEAKTARDTGDTARAVALESRRAQAQTALQRAGGPIPKAA